MITLKNGPLQATFLPDQGMTLASFRHGEIEVIDQNTKSAFHSHRAGLGPLIGPHFFCRKKETLPSIDRANFPHSQPLKKIGEWDPFSHGVARYAKWKAKADEDSITASLTGDDTLEGVALKELEGQDFKLTMTATLTENTLNLKLSHVSDTDSLVGIHYYYALPNGKGRITSEVKKRYISNHKEEKTLETESLDYPLTRSTDLTFHPAKSPTGGKITLETETHHLITTYHTPSSENCWQLYHPKDASFVCIEPISSQDPLHPNLSVSRLDISLEIIPI